MVFFYVCVFMLNSIVTSPFLQYAANRIGFFYRFEFWFLFACSKKVSYTYLLMCVNERKKEETIQTYF